MEIENSNPVLIFHHMYGTIITKKSEYKISTNINDPHL